MMQLGWLLASALGAMARFWLERHSVRRYGETWPWGTLAANLVGSFVLGFSYWALQGNDWGAVAAAFCASFTTFGGFIGQSFQRLRHRHIRWHGIAYYAGTIVGSLAVAWIGMQLGHSIHLA